MECFHDRGVTAGKYSIGCADPNCQPRAVGQAGQKGLSLSTCELYHIVEVEADLRHYIFY